MEARPDRLWTGIIDHLRDIFPQNPVVDTLIVISSAIFASPDPTAAGLSVPLLLLLQQAHSTDCHLLRLALKTISAPAIADWIDQSIPLFSGVLEGTAGNLQFSKLGRDLGIGVAYWLPIMAHQMLLRRKVIKMGWEAATVFGLLWGIVWDAWQAGSALGRLVCFAFDLLKLSLITLSQGTPTPLPADFPLLSRVARYFGNTGIDILTGTIIYLVFQGLVTAWPASMGNLIRMLEEEWRRTVGGRRRLQVATKSPYPTAVSNTGSISNQQDESRSIDGSSANISLTTTPTLYTNLSLGSLRIVPWRVSCSYLLALFAIVLCSLFFVRLPEPVSLSAPLSTITPLSIACVLPSQERVDPEEMIRSTVKLANRAKMILWPEDTFHFDSEHDEEKYHLVERIRTVCQMYGIWVIAGIGYELDPTDDKIYARSAAILVDSSGAIGWYQRDGTSPGKYYPLNF